jgi:hypothetical protein
MRGLALRQGETPSDRTDDCRSARALYCRCKLRPCAIPVTAYCFTEIDESPSAAATGASPV